MTIKLPASELDLPILGTVSGRPDSLRTINWFVSESEFDRWPNDHEFVREMLLEVIEPVEQAQTEYTDSVQALTYAQLDDIALVLLNVFEARSDLIETSEVNDENDGSAALKNALEMSAKRLKKTSVALSRKLTGHKEAMELLRNHAMFEADRLSPFVDRVADLRATIERLESHRLLFQDVQAQTALVKFRKSFVSSLGPERPFWNSLRSGFAATAAGSLILSGQFDGSLRMIDQIQEQFRISSAVSNAFNPGVMDASYIQKMLNHQGFVASAAAGFEGLASKALVSAVLTNFEREQRVESSLFDATVDELSVLDDDVDPSKVFTLLSNMHTHLEREARSTDDARKQNLIFNYAALVLGVSSVLLSLFPNEQTKVINFAPVQAEIEIVLNRSDSARGGSQLELKRLTGRWNLRQGPGMDQAVITTLNADQDVIVLSRNGEWIHIEVLQYTGEASYFGWIHTDALDTSQ